MKKLRAIATILSTIMTVTALGTIGAYAASSPPYDSAYDVNGDEKVNTWDITRLMKYMSGENVPTASGDVNGDGTVNTKDLTRLMKYIAGGELGTESEFKKTFNALANRLMTEGTYEKLSSETGELGMYTIYKKGYTSNREVYTYGLGYIPEEKALVLTYAGIGGIDHKNRAELFDTVTILITPESEQSGIANYVCIFDDKITMDLSCMVAGEFDMDNIRIEDYAMASIGDRDEAQTLEYVEKLIKHMIYNFPNEFDVMRLGFLLK